MKPTHALFAIFTVLLSSCGESGPKPPAKGTPAFYWAAAGETFKAGDYMKTNDHLEKLATGEYAARAVPWRLVLIDGLAHGYADLADKFEMGGRANKTNPAPFRRQVSLYRNRASQLALVYGDALQKFEKSNPSGEVGLDFAFPAGAAKPVVALNKVIEGIAFAEADLPSMEKQSLERAVVLAVSRAVGAGDDSAKAREAFASGAAKAPVEVFLRAMAEGALNRAEVFTPLKADQPDRFKFFCEQAAGLAKKVPDAKALTAKVDEMVKKGTRKK
jgi:hypothetical protein